MQEHGNIIHFSAKPIFVGKKKKKLGNFIGLGSSYCSFLCKRENFK